MVTELVPGLHVVMIWVVTIVVGNVTSYKIKRQTPNSTDVLLGTVSHGLHGFFGLLSTSTLFVIIKDC